MYVIESKLQQMVNGLTTAIPAGYSFDINGTSYTQAQLIALFQATLNLFPATVNAKAAYVTAVKNLHQATPGAKTLYQEVVFLLKVKLGKSNPELSKFGISTQAHKVPTPEQKAAAKAKRELTRQARHTLGKQQKRLIVTAIQPKVVILGPDGQPLSGMNPGVAPAGQGNGSTGK